jgi:radical SAM superfamily enzyme YgiQ (UPF0313 family)
MHKQTKKILFIIPPYFNIRDYISCGHTSQHPTFTVPYGILSLSAYLNKYSRHDINIDILDLNLEAFKLSNVTRDVEGEIKNCIKEKIIQDSPDVVAISALFNTCYNSLGMISFSVKQANPDILIIIGGGLATNLYNKILHEFEHIDACCYGEGEIPLCQLVDAENVQHYLKSSPSWIIRENLHGSFMPNHTFVNNIDDIPFFDYNLIDLDSYRGRSFDKSYAQKSLREMSIHTSRGCPYHCVFCANATVHGKRMRYMSVEKVIHEIENMISLHQMEILLIEDDHFLADRNRAKVILQRLCDFNLKIEFPNGVAVYAIDDDIGQLLKKAGVKIITLAVESGSDFVLKNIIHKPHRVNMIKPAVKILRKYGISIHAFIIVGLPGELETHREETMQMISDVGFDWVKFSLAVPVSGSKLYDICKENGYLVSDDFNQYVITKANIRTPDIDPEHIENEVYLMNLHVNFVNNYNLRVKKYDEAAVQFAAIAKRYPDHAFAHYFLAKSYKGLKRNNGIIKYHSDRFNELIHTKSEWAKYAKHFEIQVA